MNRWFRHFSFIFAFLLCCGASAAEVQAPKGGERSLTVHDFMPHKDPAKEFNETWSYQFVFDNGSRAFVNYSMMYVPGSGKKVGCDLTLWNFKGKTHTVGRQYPPERLVADESKALIDIKGEYKMEGKPGKGHRVLFTADKGGKFFLDVTFASAVNAKVPGDGVWKVGSEKYAQYVHIPYGRVTGRIGYEGDTIEVKGYAYMDQTWQTTQAIDIAIRSINFSTNSKDAMYAGRISIAEGGTLMGYALYSGNDGVKVALPSRVTEAGNPYNGKSFAKEELGLEFKDNVPGLKFSVKKTYQKASLLDKIDGWFAKKAAKLMAGGEVLFYRGRSDGTNGKKIDWTITGVKD